MVSGYPLQQLTLRGFYEAGGRQHQRPHLNQWVPTVDFLNLPSHVSSVSPAKPNAWISEVTDFCLGSICTKCSQENVVFLFSPHFLCEFRISYEGPPVILAVLGPV